MFWVHLKEYTEKVISKRFFLMPRYTSRSDYSDYDDDEYDDYDGYDYGRLKKSGGVVETRSVWQNKKSSTTTTPSNASSTIHSTPRVTSGSSSVPTPVTPSTSLSSTTQTSIMKATPSQQHIAKFIADVERSEDVIKGATGIIKSKNTVNVLVVGHVDAGKSTIFGHLAVLSGSVPLREKTRAQALADTYNKSTFSYAFLLDTNDDERQRGVTIDVCNHTLTLAFPELGNDYSTPRTIFLQDCPGHRDFVPSLIRAVSQPDAAVLVLDASPKEFEKGLSEDGQTLEHLQLLMIFGVKHIIIAVNKLDRTDWNEGRFLEIVTVLTKVLRKDIQFGGGFTFIPVSGIGEDGSHNLTPGNATNLPEWVRQHKSLGEEIYKIQSIRSTSQIKGEKTSPTIILYDVTPDTYEGKKVFAATCVVESGILQVSDSIVHIPSMYLFQIVSISIDGLETEKAIAYDTVTLYLAPDKRVTKLCNNCDKLDSSIVVKEMPQGSCFILTGVLLQQGPISKGVWINNMILATTVKALVLVLNTPQGISVGDVYDCYIGSSRVEARIHKINAQINPATQEIIRKNPPLVGKSAYVRMTLIFNVAVMIKEFSKSKLMGRMILRSDNRSVGLGKVERISEK